MRQHASKLETANVVAGFDNQWDADEAVLGLRIRGISDRRIGYYYPTVDGRMEDLLAQRHRFAASILGGVLGAALGGWVGLLLARWSYPPHESPDLLGLVLTCAVCGALFLGTAGGMLGLWTARPGAFAPAPDRATEPFVIAVDAGDARDEVWAILRDHGGHELRPREVAAHGPAVHPA
jgi:hypothetical protein